MAANLTIEPVFELEFTLGKPNHVGQVASGERMICVPLTGGKLRSVDGGILSGLVDAECMYGMDLSYATMGVLEFTRLTVDSLWRNKDGSIIHIAYEALVRMTDEEQKIFTAQPDAKSTGCGNVHAYFKFKTGDVKLKAMHEYMFVGTGRFVVEEGKALAVNYQIGRLVG